MLREKPIPTYRKSLPQQYQRWLYEDYAYLWTQQSGAIQAAYRAAGSRYHLTGFQYWMKYQLANQSDIAGMWRLDETAGAIAHDSSKHANHATIIGAAPIAGAIDGALYFDGVNDSVHLGQPAPLNFAGAFSLEFFLIPYALEASDVFLARDNWGGLRALYLGGGNAKVIASIWIGSVEKNIVTPAIVLTLFSTHHIVLTHDLSTLRLYVDNVLFSTPAVGVIDSPDVNWYLARRQSAGTPRWNKGIQDHLIAYSRCLDATEIKRHSERRYP